MHFSQTYRKYFAESPKICARRPKIEKQFKEVVLKNKLFQKYPWTLENSFDNPTRLFSPKDRNVLLKVWNQLKNLKVLWKRNLILQKCPMDTRKTIFTTMSKNIYKTPNIFPQSPLVGVNFLEKNDNVMQEDPLNGCRKQFSNPGGTFSVVCRVFHQNSKSL